MGDPDAIHVPYPALGWAIAVGLVHLGLALGHLRLWQYGLAVVALVAIRFGMRRWFPEQWTITVVDDAEGWSK